MDDPSPLLPGPAETGLTMVVCGIAVAVAVASYRRSRFLSSYPVWKSIAIAVVAGAFWELWLVVWWVNRDRIAWEWREYRRERRPAITA